MSLLSLLVYSDSSGSQGCRGRHATERHGQPPLVVLWPPLAGPSRSTAAAGPPSSMLDDSFGFLIPAQTELRTHAAWIEWAENEQRSAWLGETARSSWSIVSWFGYSLKAAAQ